MNECIVLFCIVFIHFYSAPHGMNLSEALPTTAIETVSGFTRRSATLGPIFTKIKSTVSYRKSMAAIVKICHRKYFVLLAVSCLGRKKFADSIRIPSSFLLWPTWRHLSIVNVVRGHG